MQNSEQVDSRCKFKIGSRGTANRVGWADWTCVLSELWQSVYNGWRVELHVTRDQWPDWHVLDNHIPECQRSREFGWISKANGELVVRSYYFIGV